MFGFETSGCLLVPSLLFLWSLSVESLELDDDDEDELLEEELFVLRRVFRIGDEWPLTFDRNVSYIKSDDCRELLAGDDAKEHSAEFLLSLKKNIKGT